ncbi:MAG: outer membrane beta-barrel protein [Verrucomicrobia bacterium]|nr:outer membrane beta-barrel protein [Verrucomicrobiota bacterium]
MVLVGNLAQAKEALRNSVAGEISARARRSKEEVPYNIKAGPVSLLFDTSVNISASDNINAAEHGRQTDVTFRPGFEVKSLWPITPLNQINFEIGVGYTAYLKHPENNSFFIKPGSTIAFDVFVGDFRINFHDQFSYYQDPFQRADVAGGTNGAAGFGIGQNIIGVTADWDLNKIMVSGGFNHASYWSLSTGNQNIDRKSEQFFLRGSTLGNDLVTVGLEGSASFTTYDQQINNDNQQYSFGPFAEWQITQFIRSTLKGGYVLSKSDSTSTNVNAIAQTLGSYYVDIGLDHTVNESLRQTLNFSRSVQLGISSDTITLFTIHHNARWKVIRNMELTTDLFYEDGSQSGIVNPEAFYRFGVGFTAGYKLTQHLDTNVSYNYIYRHSNQANRGYFQNSVALGLTYRF